MPTADRNFYVYILFRPWDGSPCYAGKGKGDRWLRHEKDGEKHCNLHLSNILKKAARLGMEIPKIKVRDGLTESEALKTEIAFIAAIGRKKNGGPLVNLTDGGDGVSGYVPSERERILTSLRHTGKTVGPDTRAKLSAISMGNKYSLGRKESPETKAKRVTTRAKTIAARGSKPPDEKARSNMSEAQKKRFADPEERVRHAERLKGTQSTETRAEK